VNTARTPGIAFAAWVSIAVIVAAACGLRSPHAVQRAGGDDVVGIAAAALKEPRILDTADRLGEAELGHDRLRYGGWIGFSMYA
jgi:hypothetical protein